MTEQLLLAVIILVCLIVLQLAAILFIRYIHVKGEQEFQRLSGVWEEPFYDYLYDGINIDELKKIIGRDINYQYLWRFMQPYLYKLRGEEVIKIRELSEGLGLTEHFEKTAMRRQGRWKKAYACQNLGILKTPAVINLSRHLLNNKVPEVVISAARSIASTGNHTHLITIIKPLLKNTKITYEGATEIVTIFGEEICPELLLMLQNIDLDNVEKPLLFAKEDGAIKSQKNYYLKDIIIILISDVLSFYRHTPAIKTLEELLSKTDNEELIIHLIKALGRIGYPALDTDLTPYLTHNNWIIRSQSARLLGQTEDERYTEILEQMLSDNKWWVRYHGARALWSLGPECREIMTKLSIGEEKAAKVCAWVIEEGQLQGANS